MKKIPDTWKQVLEDIQKVCPSAVLAGGALRDLVFDVEVKDLDIFIEAGNENEAWGSFKALGGKIPEPQKIMGGLSCIDERVSTLRVCRKLS